MRIATAEALHPDQRDQLVNAAAVARPPRQSEPDVLADRQVREQAALLRDVADAPSLGGDKRGSGRVDHRPGETDRPPIAALEPGDQTQQRRLAAA